MIPNIKIPKKSPKFICDECQYKTDNKKDFSKHLSTLKHEILINPNSNIPKNPQTIYECICKKTYKHSSSLSAHKKRCKYVDEIDNKVVQIQLDNSSDSNDNNIIMNIIQDNTDIKNLILEVVKTNSDLQKQMVEMCKSIQSNVIMNNCNNTNNNTFNMQVFLNEECKDAMNISDFVNSVNIQLEDLEDVGRLGYATGMSNIIVKELKMLDVYKRPIHCSDIKREIFYVKDNDVWERETPENSKMKKAIKGISQKNMIKLNDWRDKHPDCLDSSSSYNDIYLNLMVESCGGRGDFSVGENKILKNIAKEVVIKK